MGTCSNCGENVPLRKRMDGRPLAKQDRSCPNCDKQLDPGDKTVIRK